MLKSVLSLKSDEEYFNHANALALRDFMPRGDLALPDFCGLFKNSKFKMADGQEKHESKHVPYEEIFADINSENLPKLSKEKLQSFCNVLKLKVSGEKKELVQRLEPLGKCKQLFDKKVARIQEDYKFSTALDRSMKLRLAPWQIKVS